MIALLLVVGSIAVRAPGSAGPARVPFAAGVTRRCRRFARLHEKYRTPHVALVFKGSRPPRYSSPACSFRWEERDDGAEAYDIMVNLTILIYFLPTCTFAAFLRLRTIDKPAPDAGHDNLPGGYVELLIAGCGLLSTAIAMALGLSPAWHRERAQLRSEPGRSSRAPARRRNVFYWARKRFQTFHNFQGFQGWFQDLHWNFWNLWNRLEPLFLGSVES